MRTYTLPAVLAAFLLAPQLQDEMFAVPLLAVDFGESYEDPVMPDFLEMIGESSQLSASAVFGSYSVDLTGQGFADSNNGTAVDASVRPLYRDYYYNNSELFGEGITLAIGGLSAGINYDLTLWSYDADQVFSSTETQWSPFGDSTGATGNITNFATPRPTTLADRSTTIQVSTTTGILDIFGTTTSGFGGTRLNAFRLKDGATDVLSVDFGRPGQQPEPVQAGYEPIRGLQVQGSASETIGPYTVTVEGQGFEDTSPGNANEIDESLRNLYRGTYYNNSNINGEGVTLTIEGVTPNTDYDVKVWSYDPAQFFSSTPTVWTGVGNTSGTTGNITNFAEPRPMTLDDYSATIRVSSTTSTLEIFGTTTSGFGGTRLNAFELHSVSAAALAGDYNGNGTVDAADYTVWRDTLDSTTNLAADGSGNNVVDQADYDVWKQHFGESGAGSSLGGSAVPEPASLVLLLSIALLATRQVFRRKW
ncbi:MAG: hypothetical protein WD851_02105 [Pirellulales bacterium]